MSKTLAEVYNEFESNVIEAPKTDLDLCPTKTYFYADYQCKLIREQLTLIESGLKEKQTISIKIGNVSIIIAEIAFKNPSLVIFKGYSNDCFCELIQNVNQINILIEVIHNEVGHKPIGFDINECG